MARKSIYPPSVTPGIPNLGQKPEGWIETTFAKVLRVVERKAELHDNTEYQLVTAKRNREGIVPRTRLLGKEILTKTQFFIKSGDFLISKRQIIHGACGVVPPGLDGAIVSNEYVTLQPKDSLILEYLEYFSHTVYFQQTCFQCSVGVDVEKMVFSTRDWLKYKVYLPPLPEQRKTADILSTSNQAIALTERCIKAARQRKKGLMQRLLTGRVQFPEFEGEKGQEVHLGDLGETYSGLSGKSKEDFGQGKPYIPYLNIYNNWAIDPGQMDYVSIRDGERQNCVKCGDVFFTTSSETPDEVGMSSVLLNDLGEAYLNSFCYGFRLKNFDSLLPEYAVYLLRGEDFRHTMHYLAQGATRYNLTKRYLIEVPLLLPPLPEQRRIATVLQTCDREIDLLIQKRDALQRQKKGLMQRLLTGRVRVRV